MASMVGARLARRVLQPRGLAQEVAFATSRAITTKIPAGASPQILVSASAPHRAGAAKDVAELIFEHGASIASTKKVMLENHFAMLLTVWTPPSSTSPAALAQKLQSPEVTEKLGFSMQATLLEPSSMPVSDDVLQQRRLKLSCPQRPGIVLAITELLKDHGCKMSHISADTTAKGADIWFEIEAIVDVPAGVDPAALEGALRVWTDSEASRAQLIFDSWLHGASMSPLSHA